MKPAYRATVWLAAAALGFLQIWAHRYYVNPDGVSYIELGWAGLWHGLRGFVNGYWSPLYPALLSLAFRVARPGPATESTVVHLANFLIYLASLACFELFVRELLRARRELEPASSADRVALPNWAVWTWGYVFFLWASVLWLRPMLVTPDLCVAALCYLAVAILLRIRRSGRTGEVGERLSAAPWSVYLLLGTVLGLAYLAKTFMFLLAWVFLACSVGAAPRWRRALPRALAAALVFMIIAAPEILALSRAKGRWTYGDTGELNYAWYVDRVPPNYGLGVPPAAGVPLHPARQASNDPPIYEFAGPLSVTDPLAFDPSYWYEGVHPYFTLRGQARALLGSLSLLLQMFSRSGALYAVFLVLGVLLWPAAAGWSGAGPPQWAIWLPAYAAFGIYSLVHIEPRFVGEFGLMLLVGLFAAVHPAREQTEGRPLCLLTAAITVVAVVAIVANAAVDLRALVRHQPDPVFALAGQIEALGVSSGHYVGSQVDPLGDSRELVARLDRNEGAYWAHLAGLRIAADLADPRDYWNGDAAARARVMQTFAGLGIRVVVAELVRPATVPPVSLDGWTAVPGTDFYIFRIAGGAVSAANLPAASANPSWNRGISR